MKLLDNINEFMNNSDRGPGHAIGNSVWYGLFILPFTSFLPLWAILILLFINHLRVFYEEWVMENWKDYIKKRPPERGDFYFDCIMRPLATDAFVLGFGYLPSYLWGVASLLTIVIAFKKKNQWPLLAFWKK